MTPSRIVIFVLVVSGYLTALLPHTVLAQFKIDGIIALYSDSEFTSTKAIDTTPGRILTVYVVHQSDRQDVKQHYAADFRIVRGGGFTGTWLSDTPRPGWSVGGNSQDGIWMYYLEEGLRSCLRPPTHLLTVQYALLGTSPANSFLEVTGAPPPDPLWGLCVRLYWCGMRSGDYPDIALGGRLTINSTVPVEATTWGRIKNLYR